MIYTVEFKASHCYGKNLDTFILNSRDIKNYWYFKTEEEAQAKMDEIEREYLEASKEYEARREWFKVETLALHCDRTRNWHDWMARGQDEKVRW